jgi:nucleoside-diphosphate-sugar epimerase
MRVLVTGGTGFVGCHAAAALRRNGHEVRLLVRRPERMARALEPLGIADLDFVVGDVTDAESLKRAVDGCDAVVHAAAIFTLDRRREDEVMHVNVRGSENVFDAAIDAALDPIVYVSSVSALFPPDGDRVGPDEPVKSPRDFYARSKALTEAVARKHQADGRPLVSVYPGAVWGPFDPTLADGIAVIMGFVKQGYIPVTPGGMPMVDVRDLGSVLAAALQPGRGHRRYMFGGNFLNNAELTDTLNSLTGKNLRKVSVPGPAIRAIGRLGDILRRGAGINIGLTYEAALTLTYGVPCDNTRVEAELGLRNRPAVETLRDTLRWMYATGVLERKHVGRLAD